MVQQESCAIAKMTAQYALYTGAQTSPTANFHGLLVIEATAWAHTSTLHLRLRMKFRKIWRPQEATKIFGTSWLRPRLLCQNFPWAFVPIDPMNVRTKFEVRSFTNSSDNRRYPKVSAVPEYAHAPSSPKVLKGFSSDASSECTCQI